MVTSKSKEWRIFRSSQTPHNRIYEEGLPPPPRWRSFGISQAKIPENSAYRDSLYRKSQENLRDRERGESYYIQTTQGQQEQVIEAVNAALYLRRPLIVTGRPGSGKTSLAYAVAYQLKLGPVLMWPITVRSTLQDALYQYDAISRLQDAQLTDKSTAPNIGDYLRFGPLGTAFLPDRYPRVLLIDEIDKAEINLPNDLLNLFEEGGYESPELVRLAKSVPEVGVMTADGLEASIGNGKVQCGEFPLVIMTSNGERDFPPAFLRRCIRVHMPLPTTSDLLNIVKSHFGSRGFEDDKNVLQLIEDFVERRDAQDASLATDQLLNTVYLLTHHVESDNLKDLLLKALTSAEDYA